MILKKIMIFSNPGFYASHSIPAQSRCQATLPVPSSRHHLRNDDHLEIKREDYQNCSVLYCVQQLCTVIPLICTHTQTQTQTTEKFLQLTAGLGLVLLSVRRLPFCSVVVVCFSCATFISLSTKPRD